MTFPTDTTPTNAQVQAALSGYNRTTRFTPSEADRMRAALVAYEATPEQIALREKLTKYRTALEAIADSWTRYEYDFQVLSGNARDALERLYKEYVQSYR